MEGQAVFPRVVVDDSESPEAARTNNNAALIHRDSDGKLYLDFFRVLDLLEESKRAEQLDRIRINLAKRVKKHCKYAFNVLDSKKITATEGAITKHS